MVGAEVRLLTAPPMKRVLRLALAAWLLLALLAALWSQIPDIDTDADIDAALGRD